MRCQEYIDICDSAQPIIELIETGTTDVSHLIAKAKGPSKANELEKNGRDPAGEQNKALGRSSSGIYKPLITDEEVG